ncbi:unnamed protein product [Rangifer tarandus platyrhynchus]|uniref:Uncharacterized protein n=1 Tax=Rangifer tarandus platyrhynchus TaxID=3082113 RepID=A0ABN8Y0G9_RANTA|nr:unnamed protein product [Rangifer tarandus platyrhynchus]
MVPLRSTGLMQGTGENGKTAAEGNRELLKSPLSPFTAPSVFRQNPSFRWWPLHSGGDPSALVETDPCEQSESREAIFWLRDPHALHLALLFFQMVVMITTWCILSPFSLARLFVTLWTVAHQTPLSMGFSRQEYWSGLPRPPPEDLPDPGIEPASLMSPALAGRFFTTSTAWEANSW